MTDDLEDFEFAVVNRFPRQFKTGRTTTLASPRELVDHLAARIESEPDQRSIKQSAFYQIRQILSRELQRNPGTISPRTRLDQLMSDETARREHWNRIRATLAIRLFPLLARPEALVWAITLVVGSSFLAVVILAAIFLRETSLILPVASVFAALFLAFAIRSTDRWATRFIPSTLTVGDLASFATAYGSKFEHIAIQPSTRPQIIEVVRDLVRLEIGATKFDLDSSWLELSRSARRAP